MLLRKISNTSSTQAKKKKSLTTFKKEPGPFLKWFCGTAATDSKVADNVNIFPLPVTPGPILPCPIFNISGVRSSSCISTPPQWSKLDKNPPTAAISPTKQISVIFLSPHILPAFWEKRWDFYHFGYPVSPHWPKETDERGGKTVG